MKAGSLCNLFPFPEGTPRVSQLEWCIENATDFPVQVVHAFGGLYPEDLQELESLGDRAREKNLEVECGPPREAVFHLTSPVALS